MARFATISEIEICRLKSIITEYYFREILQRDFTERLYRDFISYTERNFMKRDFISYTEREILQVIQREPDRELRNVSGVMNGLPLTKQ